ncbi:unnamed protein product [Paramecium primaurelia]|uniref:Uncharacterized protein n=2 Tax=Paramecium TaxID=5884 RepID=A0A8S1N147_PARPR|nr:unnamed protein product [Paramecium primaurelia]CAD8086280.1 unnamed protein product [Paramecium primaurelia]CAD8170125.1 unnamed protein product [Paramecium pentaurelia]CAD8185603.1 unnamed protein product [Paramecium pentaurelia]
MTAKDVIMKMNKEAEYNALTADFQGNDTKFVGEYENVKIPSDKKEIIKDAFRKVAIACKPTLKNLTLRQNWLDMQDRVYNRAQYYTTDANSCISDARNVAEVNLCCDNYIQRLNNDFYNDVLQILKDY